MVTDVVMPEMDGRDLARRLLVRETEYEGVVCVRIHGKSLVVRNGLLEPDTLFLEKSLLSRKAWHARSTGNDEPREGCSGHGGR